MSFKSLSRPIEHNEYLRLKYGIGEATHERKVKKKKTIDSSSKKTNLKIFDDDIDLKKIKIKKAFEGDDEDDAYFGVEEDKPIIEEVIDERPLAVKNKDKEGTKWKPLSEDKEEKKDGLKSNHDTKGKEKKKQSEPIKHGLTTASVMKKERKRLKEQEAKLFKELGSEFLGKNAKSIYRDKTTGRVRDLEAEKMEEEAREKEIDEKEAAAKQKFKEMTVGIKQVEEKKAQLEDELHEMSKPFARYEDDADLDAYLRVRELADDPMLSYIRKKRKKEEEASGQLDDKKVILKYNGPTPPPPNRFNIPPGHRWDGVDRSNGYESKYFKQLSDKKSTQEEAYRWATEDM